MTFNEQMVNILDANFKDVNGNPINFDILIGSRNNETMTLIEQAEYLQSVKLKLMDYVSSRHAISGLRINTKGKKLT